jgi:hypothetical protein
MSTENPNNQLKFDDIEASNFKFSHPARILITGLFTIKMIINLCIKRIKLLIKLRK